MGLLYALLRDELPEFVYRLEEAAEWAASILESYRFADLIGADDIHVEDVEGRDV
jgi:hypothetical protein